MTDPQRPALGSRTLLGGLLVALLVPLCAGCSLNPLPGDREEPPAEEETGGPAQVGGASGASLPHSRKGEPQGTGCDDLVPIEAGNEVDGIAAEGRWLREHYPGWRKVEQALSMCGEKPVDSIEIRDADGRAVRILFDISSFFGKM
jgi:hypothetical protein